MKWSNDKIPIDRPMDCFEWEMTSSPRKSCDASDWTAVALPVFWGASPQAEPRWCLVTPRSSRSATSPRWSFAASHALQFIAVGSSHFACAFHHLTVISMKNQLKNCQIQNKLTICSLVFRPSSNFYSFFSVTNNWRHSNACGRKDDVLERARLA